MCQVAVLEVTRRIEPFPALEAPEDDGAAEAEINAAFRRMLSGLRYLRRDERAAAVRAAREWLVLEMKGLRNRRANDRRARIALRRLRRPPRRQPG
jgi:hypothetical protein